MAKVLITGGLGYLGGRIAHRLVDAGHTVSATTRRPRNESPAWLPSMRVISPDWDNEQELLAACSGIDCVVHLAAMNEVHSVQDPIGALHANGLASLKLLQAAQTANVSRFIYFSTAHVYGAPLQGSITETTLPRPQHPYAITHRVTEDFVLAAHDAKKIDGIVVRLSNGFGAPMVADVDRWTLLVNDLCRQAITTGELRLMSHGLQMRDFITLEDVANAVQHLIELDRTLLSDGLFNVGDQARSIFEMTQRVATRASLLLNKAVPVLRPETHGAMTTLLDYDCTKLKATGFTLLSRVDEEIDATLRLCKNAFGN